MQGTQQDRVAAPEARTITNTDKSSTQIKKPGEGLPKKEQESEKKPFSGEFKVVLKDGRSFAMNLRDISNIDELRQALRAQGAEDMAGKQFVPTLGFWLEIIGSQLQAVMPDLIQKISDAFNPKKKNGEDEGIQNKKMKTYTFVATDGRRFILRIPKNHTIEDVKHALRLAGANDLAEQIAYSRKDSKKEWMQKLTKNILDAVKTVLPFGKRKPVVPNKQ